MQKKGISLIVLIITIIVMIILAATIIISLNNNGIIDKASEAVDKTNEKQVEELVNLAWADAYAENVGKSNEELLQALKTSVEKALSNNNVNKEDYGIEVTTTGVTIVKGWLQKANRTVVKGNTTLEIGDYVNYVSGVSGYTDTNGWQVLGAENGELLILSSEFIKDNYGAGGDDWVINGVSRLNAECEPYGKGKNAIKARCLTVEDVDRISGYDKTTYEDEETYLASESGPEITLKTKYGEKITYKYNGTNTPDYESSIQSGTLTTAHTNGFYWYEEGASSLKHIELSELLSESNIGKEIVTLTMNAYEYNLSNYLDETGKAFKMLTRGAGYMCFLANVGGSKFGDTHVTTPGWSLAVINGSGVHAGVGAYVTTNEGSYYGTSGAIVRAVVQLSSDTTLTGSSEAGWNIV